LILYIYIHTHTHKEKEKEKESSFVEGFLHSHPVVLLYRKTYKRDTLFLQNASNSSLQQLFKNSHATKKISFLLFRRLKEITTEFVVAVTVLFRYSLRVTSPKKKHQQKQRSWGKNILCLSLSCVLLTPSRRIRRHRASSEVRRKDTHKKTYRATPIVPPPM